MLLAPLILLFPSAIQGPNVADQAQPTAKPAWTTSISRFWIEPAHEAGYLSAILYADRGFLVSMNVGKTWITAYVFNPELDDPYWTVAVGAGF